MDNGNIAPISAFLAKKWVKAVLILDVVLIVGMVIFGVVQSGWNAIVNFEVAPLDAEISLNGKGGYKNGEYKVFPGEYEVKIAYEGMETKTLDVKVEANEYVTVTTFLKGEDGGFSYYEVKDNYSDYESLKGMAAKGDNRTYDGDTSAEGFIEKFETAYRKLEKLPLVYEVRDEEDLQKSVYFVVDSGKGCVKTLCLEISAMVNSTEEDVRRIVSEKEYDLEEFELIFREGFDI